MQKLAQVKELLDDMVLENEYFRMWKALGGIHWIVFKQEGDINPVTGNSFILKAIDHFYKKNKIKILVDLEKREKIRKSNNDFFVKVNLEKYIGAIGFIAKYPINRDISSFFLNFNNPQVTVRIFTDTQRAVDWIKTIKL